MYSEYASSHFLLKRHDTVKRGLYASSFQHCHLLEMPPSLTFQVHTEYFISPSCGSVRWRHFPKAAALGIIVRVDLLCHTLFGFFCHSDCHKLLKAVICSTEMRTCNLNWGRNCFERFLPELRKNNSQLLISL